MDAKQILIILDKYFAGESSREEEALLRAYFSHAAIDQKLEAYRSLFACFAEVKQLELPKDFDAKLLERLQVARPASALRVWRVNIMRLAAAILLAIGVWQGIAYLLPAAEVESEAVAAVDWSRFEPESPEEALRIAQSALMKASSALNRGMDVAAEEIEKVKELDRFTN
jgi:hypothetical protein